MFTQKHRLGLGTTKIGEKTYYVEKDSASQRLKPFGEVVADRHFDAILNNGFRDEGNHRAAIISTNSSYGPQGEAILHRLAELEAAGSVIEICIRLLHPLLPDIAHLAIFIAYRPFNGELPPDAVIQPLLEPELLAEWGYAPIQSQQPQVKCV